jgi:hypothetical protein
MNAMAPAFKWVAFLQKTRLWVNLDSRLQPALLSQEGSTIETKSRSCEGWFPNRQTDEWSPWNHPPSTDVGSRFAIPLPS